MTQLVAVSLADVHHAWLAALPLLEQLAARTPELTLPELWRIVRSGDGELWLAGSEEGGTDAVGITRIREWGPDTVAYIVGVSGKNGAWLKVQPEFHEALRARGASKIIAEGRLGFARRWPGARVIRQTYEVELG